MTSPSVITNLLPLLAMLSSRRVPPLLCLPLLLQGGGALDRRD